MSVATVSPDVHERLRRISVDEFHRMKASLYARAGIPEYWIANLAARRAGPCEHAQRFRHGLFAVKPTNRLRDLRESSFVVLEDVEEIVRVLVGPAPGERQGLQDDVGSGTAHEHVA